MSQSPRCLILRGSYHSVPFSNSWIPVFADRDQRLSVMSIAFLLAQEDDAVIWRGPKKNGKTTRFTVANPKGGGSLSFQP